MSAKTVENVQNKIPPFVQKSFLASNTGLSRFYHLIKTHKAGPDIKIRPIVSNLNGPAQRISWFLANALKPYNIYPPTVSVKYLFSSSLTSACQTGASHHLQSV